MNDLLSVIVLTKDEEANLPACLESLRGLEADVFVVDSGSTDRTVKIAEEWGAKVVSHAWPGYGVQRNWALDHLPLRAEWVLHLDADERVTPALAERLAKLGEIGAGFDAFRLQQHTHWMGRWIKHGGFHPFYQARLHRRGKARYEERAYDQRLVPDGRVGEIKAAYINIVTDSLTEWTTRHNRWASLEAATVVDGDRTREHVSYRDGPIEKRLWLRQRVYYRQPLFVRAFMYFFLRYFIRLGFLDGREGLVFHVLHGLWYRFLVDAKIFEMRRARR